jgi:hypothetical protein
MRSSDAAVGRRGMEVMNIFDGDDGFEAHNLQPLFREKSTSFIYAFF